MRWSWHVRWALVGGAVALAVVGCTPDEETAGSGPDTVITPPGVGNPGLDGRVSALAVYGDQLYAAGTFTMAGDVPVERLARWNGARWDSVGGGVVATRQGRGEGTGVASALAVFNGSLAVGGLFDTAGDVPAQNLAFWDGTTWSTLIQGSPNGKVNALLVDGVNLYVAGDFTTVGGAASRDIGAFDGTTWRGFGVGVGGALGQEEVNALAVYNGQLIAGGTFATAGDTLAKNIARWTGTRWTPLAEGFDGSVLALATYEDRLYAGGVFDEAEGEWQRHVAVDEGFDAGQFVDLEIDDEGHAHMIYYDATNGDARYTFYDGDTFTDELIDAEGDVGLYGSIEVLGDGTPYVSYYDESNRDIKFAFRPGTSWLVETVRANGDVGEWSSLALDAAGRAHIAYYHADSVTALELASKNGANWTFQIVDEGIDLDTPQLGGFHVGRASKLAIDRAGRFHVVYYDSTSRSTRYGLRTSGGWALEYLDRAPLTDPTQTRGRWLALALDEAGEPHVAVHEYRGNANGGERLRYLRKVSGNWIGEPIETPTALGSRVGRYPSIAIDRDGTIHVTYAGVTRGTLRYAFRPDLLWQRLSLDTGGVGQFSSLAFVGGRYGRVAYYDQTEGRLKLAERGLPTPIRRIACWDGTTWSELGEGVNWWTRTMMVAGPELLVGGAFTEAGGTPADHLASWDGSTWAPVISGLNGNVWTLAMYQGDLYVGGEFTRRGPYTANYVVKLD